MSKKKKKRYKKVKQKNRKRIILPIIILILGFIIGSHIYSNTTEPAKVVKKYFALLNEQKYEDMYELVETDMTQDEFVNRIKNIYEGIEAKNIKINVNANLLNKEDKDINITYINSMDTIAGNVNFSNVARIKNENNTYKLIWNSSMIFPELNDDEKIRVTNLECKRGNLFDRNGISITKEGTAYSVGIVIGKTDQTTNYNKIAELLNIPLDTIKQKINSENQEGNFVELKKISKQEQNLKNELLTIKGVMISDIEVRSYPYKEATSIMTGYVQDGEGKTGLEYAFNDRLKGTDGKEIYIEKDGVKIKTVVKKEQKDGQDIKLTIDAELQKKIYEQFKDDEGTSVAINYNTGEILALVSTPAYDANDFILGISEEKWNNLQQNKKNPMYNRYLSTYAPGSSIKPIIGAIGILNNDFTAEEDFGKSGLKWQKDASWNKLFVTTMEEYNEPANLENALVYSDNIYFAKAALKIGKDNLKKYLDQFGFYEQIEFVQEISKSTYGSIESEASIANTGYGQNELMVNPIHMASMYSAFANGGSMVKPYIEFEKNEKSRTKIWKENIISEEISNEIAKDLIEVVKRGTAKEAYSENKVLAGKTGTAEIKKSQEDKSGNEIGWFNCFDDKELLIVSLVQNVKELGGSHYTVKKVNSIFNE